MEANKSGHGPVRPAEKLLLEPWQSVWRVVYGFGVALLIERLLGTQISLWGWLLTLLGALVVLRVAPLVGRKALPFSKEIEAVWFGQRQLGRQYDSYQWAKLLWLGIGIGTYVVLAGRFGNPVGGIALVCILAGAVGTIMWLRVQARMATSGGGQNERK